MAAFATATGRPLWAWRRRGNATADAVLVTANRVYVGGAFGSLAGVTAHGLAALDPRTGSPLATWHPPSGTQVDAPVASGGRILVGAL